jgi:GT2 family glycosyltransferase
VARRCAPWARVITRPAVGYAAAANHGVSEATSPILGFLDADDRWDRDALARRLERLGEPDAPDVVVGATQNYVSPDLSGTEASNIRVLTRTFHAEIITASLVRSEVFRRVGLLDETLRTGSAIDWVSRARVEGVTIAHVEDVVLFRRIHSSNLGRTQQQDRNADLLQIVRAHHARHRPS